jgi:hypothetical protein
MNKEEKIKGEENMRDELTVVTTFNFSAHAVGETVYGGRECR